MKGSQMEHDRMETVGSREVMVCGRAYVALGGGHGGRWLLSRGR